MNNIKKSMLGLSCAAILAGVAGQAQAADWLMLQGTERDGAAPRAKLWGFIQAGYQQDEGEPNGAGGYVAPKLLGPDLHSQSGFNINRARIGARGTGMPIAPDVNYFIMAEFGNNGMTYSEGGATRIADASITMNQLKDVARVRAGLFKIPMSEEVFQGIGTLDYINFTWGGNQLLIERFPNEGVAVDNVAPITLPAASGLNKFDRPVGAARDTGIQLFNTYKMDSNLEFSWAAMVGNGNGLNFVDNDDNKDTYVYASLTKVLGGKGPKRDDLKVFGWYQDGVRTGDFDYVDATGAIAINDNGTAGDATDDYPEVTGDGVDDTYAATEHDRTRWGAGMKYMQKPFRFTAEYIKAEGMIFQGPDKPSFDMNGLTKPGASGLDGEASSWYVEGGYYIPGTNWEVDARYDVLNRLEDDKFETKFTGATLGLQYHFNKKTRLTVNYIMNTAEAVNFGTGAGPNANLDGVGDRFAAQVTAIF